MHGRISRFIFPIGVVSLVLLVQVLPGPRPVDDAYITFRYARNLAQGLGFVYNPGDHVLGTTTPLYTIVLSALYTLLPRADIAWLAVVINAICDVFSVLLLRRFVLALGQPPLPSSLIALAYLFGR